MSACNKKLAKIIQRDVAETLFSAVNDNFLPKNVGLQTVNASFHGCIASLNLLVQLHAAQYCGSRILLKPKYLQGR